MPVITRDAIIPGPTAEATFAWLSEPSHHATLASGAFAAVTERGPGVLELTLAIGPGFSLRLDYAVDRSECEHGGRRVHVRIRGRRTRGALRFSLRPAHPGPATLATLHLDYEPGHLLGMVVDRLLLRQALEGACDRLLQNLARLVASA
jgi:hypothetical protein